MASHDRRAPLEALPTEILQMILSRMACTEDLSAAMKASPRILQSFLGWREKILIRVIQSSFDAEIFQELLGLVDVPNFGNLHYVPEPQYAGFLSLDRDSVHRHAFCRSIEQRKLAQEFKDKFFERLGE
ncbi:hypothetical protein LA080_016119 [Diaporthe eres]|nr:hypothetical protein LA080_016119 [Diaporthe eres]